MDHLTYDSLDYIYAHHSEINRSISNGRIPRRISYRLPLSWLHLMGFIGDNLITLGSKIKHEVSCAEFLQSQS